MKIIFLYAGIIAIVWSPARFAFALGTPAGTNITSQASATYMVNTTPFSGNSNINSIMVDELLDVNIVWQDAINVTVKPGDTSQVVTCRLTNTGNGTDGYTLAGLSMLLGDDFDPTLVDLYLDTNTNGLYNSGIDAQYIPGVNDPLLSADAFTTVFVLNNIPIGQVSGDLGNTQLTATSNTASGLPGTIVAGGGDGGGDAIVGTSGGLVNNIGIYEINDVEVSLVKSASVLDPLGGTKPVTDSVITYSILVTISGTGTANNVVITDVIPANTTYSPGTLVLNGVLLTDAVDIDAGDVSGTLPNTVTVNLGDLPPASTDQDINFNVTIN